MKKDFDRWNTKTGDILAIVSASAVVHNFNQDAVLRYPHRKDDPRLAHTDAVMVSPVPRESFKVYRGIGSGKFLNRSFYGFNGKLVGQMPLRKKFLGSAGEQNYPLHCLYVDTQFARPASRGLFVEALYSVLFLFRYHRQERGAQMEHFLFKHFAHAFARKLPYFFFKSSSHGANIASRPSLSMGKPMSNVKNLPAYARQADK